MSDLESRLKRQLVAQSESLPTPTLNSTAAMTQGRSLRRRSAARSAAGLIFLLGGLAAGLGPALRAIGPEGTASEKVVADQPEITADDRSSPQRDGSARATLEVETSPTASTTVTTTTATPRTSTTGTPTGGASITGSPTEPTTATTIPTGQDTGPSEIGTAAVVADLPSDSVLFYSDHEGCEGIENARAHPDWMEGQPDDSRNDDGTPTYGFAYNTGDVTAGDISWGFVQSDLALSGRCVLSLTMNRADDSSYAVRLFRRYDDGGNPLPDEAFYSVWLYFPEEITYQRRGTIEGQPAFGFWNVFQIKNDVLHRRGEEATSLSAFSFNAGKLPGEPHMALSAYVKAPCESAEECDAAFSIGQVEPQEIPVGRWVHFELYLRSRPDTTGQMTVWQDGLQILDFSGQTERPNTEKRTWSINSMGHLHTTPSHSLLVDDPVISTEPIHQKLFGS